MSIASGVQRFLRTLGWELQRYRNAHIEPQVLRRILRFTGVQVVLDVGANIGQYGDVLLETGFDGTLISFEAIPAVHRQLQAHALDVTRKRLSRSGRSGQWIVAPGAALGSQRGTTVINVSENLVSSSVLAMHSAHLAAAPQSRYVEQHSVPVERLDELAPPLLPPAGQLLIKIDTQGYELEVLKGATGLLSRTAAMQLELSLLPLYDGAPDFMELISYLRSCGFELFSIIPGFKDPQSGRLLQVDGFFVRADLQSPNP